MSSQLKVLLLVPHGLIPSVGTDGAAGYDLYACEEAVIPVGHNTLVGTGVALEPPEGTYLQIVSRSGLAYRHGIVAEAGVIDPDFRGEVKVLLRNFGLFPYRVELHERIAQVICHKIDFPDVTLVTDLRETSRGDAGFGSTDGAAGLSPTNG